MTSDTSDTVFNDLDLSWIEEDTRMSKINQNFIREPMKYIYTYCIYINKNKNIDKIVSSVQELTELGLNLGHGLSQSFISQFIQTNQILSTGVKYKLLDLLVYNVDLEPENIQGFSKTEDLNIFTSRFLQPALSSQDIVITPSIFIFHNLNSIYFMFQEEDIIMKSEIKSALRTSTTSSHKKTKKVSIHCNNHTRKYQESKSSRV
jgi:hypothetical protein